MDIDQLTADLSTVLPEALAQGLVANYIQMQRDLMAGATGHSAPGRFVEFVVQSLQHLETGKYDTHPSVDSYLKGLESRTSSLSDGLRICASRIARSMYCVRSKRNMVHLGEIDSNLYDLEFVYNCAKWLMSELLRHALGSSMERAGRSIGMIRAPIDLLIHVNEDGPLVLEDIGLRDELLLILNHFYPRATPNKKLYTTMKRRSPGGIRKCVSRLWEDRLVRGDGKEGYVLSARGLKVADEVAVRAMASALARP